MINGTMTTKACRAITRNTKRKTISYENYDIHVYVTWNSRTHTKTKQKITAIVVGSID